MKEKEYFEMLKEKWSEIWPHPSIPKEPVYPFGRIPITEYLEKYAEINPLKNYVIYYGRKITYREMNQLSNKFANYLIENGLNKGERVALTLPNTPQFYIGYFGTLKSGGICTLLNPMLKEIELEYFLGQSKPKFILTLDSLYYMINKITKDIGLNAVVIPTSFSEFLPEKPEIPVHPSMVTIKPKLHTPYLTEILENLSPQKPDIKITLYDYATMNFTGGTTAAPKGLLHKHLGVIYTAAGMYTYDNAALTIVEHYANREVDFNSVASKIATNDVFLSVMPIFWIAGLDHGVLYPTFSGATVVTLTRWDVTAAMEAIQKYKVSSMYLAFDLYWEILNHPEVKKYDLSSLRFCVGSSFVKGLTRELRKKWKELTGAIIREWTYGLTETHTHNTFTTGFHKDDMDIEKIERYGGIFCGIPIPDTLIKIVDKEGKIVPLGEKGEVLIMGPSVVEEYVGNPDETAKTFKENWMRTGDIGMYDENGFFFYVSREKYMLKVSGISVYPTQIEFLMLKHPAIEQIGVIGVSDLEKGQVPIAYIKLKEEYKGKITENEILSWCKEHMAPYNVPKKVIIKDALPLSTTGKVLREELSKWYSKEAEK